MGKVLKLVRFPNESSYQEIMIDMLEFKPEKFFGDEIFGNYGNMYIAIKVEKNLLEAIDPIVSDNFQIGPDGAFEYQDDETTWDDILNEIEINLHAEIPIRVKNWLKNTFESPKYKK